MLTPYTERQKTLIINNVVKAVKQGSEHLTNSAYKYLYICSGFIAHYNREGFIAHYHQHSLKRDILDNQHANRWANFRPGDQNYDYYMVKAEVYKRIVEKLQ